MSWERFKDICRGHLAANLSTAFTELQEKVKEVQRQYPTKQDLDQKAEDWPSNPWSCDRNLIEKDWQAREIHEVARHLIRGPRPRKSQPEEALPTESAEAIEEALRREQKRSASMKALLEARKANAAAAREIGNQMEQQSTKKRFRTEDGARSESPTIASSSRLTKSSRVRSRTKSPRRTRTKSKSPPKSANPSLQVSPRRARRTKSPSKSPPRATNPAAEALKSDPYEDQVHKKCSNPSCQGEYRGKEAKQPIVCTICDGPWAQSDQSKPLEDEDF